MPTIWGGQSRKTVGNLRGDNKKKRLGYGQSGEFVKGKGGGSNTLESDERLTIRIAGALEVGTESSNGKGEDVLGGVKLSYSARGCVTSKGPSTEARQAHPYHYPQEANGLQ